MGYALFWELAFHKFLQESRGLSWVAWALEQLFMALINLCYHGSGWLLAGSYIHKAEPIWTEHLPRQAFYKGCIGSRDETGTQITVLVTHHFPQKFQRAFSPKKYYLKRIKSSHQPTSVSSNEAPLQPAPVFSNKTISLELNPGSSLHEPPCQAIHYLCSASSSLHFNSLLQLLSIRKEIPDLHSVDTSFTTHLLSAQHSTVQSARRTSLEATQLSSPHLKQSRNCWIPPVAQPRTTTLLEKGENQLDTQPRLTIEQPVLDNKMKLETYCKSTFCY